MKILGLIVILGLTSCGPAGEFGILLLSDLDIGNPFKDTSFCRDSNVDDILSKVSVGDYILDDKNVQRVFSDCKASESNFEWGNYCSNTYFFHTFNEITFEFNYYYDISTDCGNDIKITSIYKG